MPLTFHIRNRTYMLDGVEGIVVKYEHLLDRARELVEKHELDGKIGDNFIDIALDNLEEMLKAKAEMPKAPNINLTAVAPVIYVRYDKNDRCVHLITSYENGKPVFLHTRPGDHMTIEFGPTPSGPWTLVK